MSTVPTDDSPTFACVVSPLNFGRYPMSNGIPRPETRFLGEPESVGKAQAAIGKPLDGTDADRLGLGTESFGEADWDDVAELELPACPARVRARPPLRAVRGG